MKNDLICYICNRSLQSKEKIAKIILIKETSAYTTEYVGDQKEIYCHFNCLISISCHASNNENFNHDNSSIINGPGEILKLMKEENVNSFIRSNILNF